MKSHFWCRALGGMITAVVLSACSTLGPTSFNSLSPSATRILLPVPFRPQQTESECGLAAVSMVAAYYRQSLKPAAIADLKMDAATKGGISGKALETALKQSGFYSVIFRGSFGYNDTGLYHHLQRGRPMIIMLMQYGSMNGQRTEYGHYVVVVGYDAANDKEYALDPLRGAVIYSESRLNGYWRNSNYFSALVMPAELVSGKSGASVR